VRQRRERRNDEKRAAHAKVAAQVLDDRHRLHRLAEAHLVGENRVAPLEPALAQPIEALALVRPQLVAVFERVVAAQLDVLARDRAALARTHARQAGCCGARTARARTLRRSPSASRPSHVDSSYGRPAHLIRKHSAPVAAIALDGEHAVGNGEGARKRALRIDGARFFHLLLVALALRRLADGVEMRRRDPAARVVAAQLPFDQILGLLQIGIETVREQTFHHKLRRALNSSTALLVGASRHTIVEIFEIIHIVVIIIIIIVIIIIIIIVVIVVVVIVVVVVIGIGVIGIVRAATATRALRRSTIALSHATKSVIVIESIIVVIVFIVTIATNRTSLGLPARPAPRLAVVPGRRTGRSRKHSH
jgi:hypothetical protein